MARSKTVTKKTGASAKTVSAAKSKKAVKAVPKPKSAPPKPVKVKSAKPAKVPKSKTAQPAEKGSYADYVVEAVQALQSADKPFVGIQAIRGYIFSYIEAANPPAITRLAKSAINKLVASKVLKQKKASVAFASRAGDLAEEAAPKRKIVREKAAATDAGPGGGLIQQTRSGRISLKRF